MERTNDPSDGVPTTCMNDLEWLTLVFVGCTPAELETIDQETVHIARRRAEVAMLLKPGTHTYERIGEIVRRSKTTIVRDVKAIREHFLRLAASNYRDHVARELHFNTMLLNEAWEAWERSKQPKVDKSDQERLNGESLSLNSTVKKVQRDGNPAFLQRIESIWVNRLKLLGLIGEAAETKQQAATDRLPEKLVVGVATSELV